MTGAIPPSGTTPAMGSFCIQVPNSSEWLGILTGALLKLTYNYYWDKDYDNWEEARDTGKAILNSWLDHNPCLAEITGEAGCSDFPMSAGFINFYPSSPYLQPTFVPDGWTGVPFVFAGSGDIALGYQSGDIIVSAFPEPDSGDLTLPSVTFNLTGTGKIEVHLIGVPNGGQAVVTIDGNLLNSEVFDLNTDEITFPQETLGTAITYEHTFDTTGSHTVEVRFSPVLDDTLIPVRYGGAIRGVSLCGFDEMTLDIRQKPDNSCILQRTYDGVTWEDFADFSDCSLDVVNNNVENKTLKLWRVSGGVTQYVTNNNTYNNYSDTQASDFGQVVPYPDGVPSGVDAPCIAAKNNVAVFAGTVSEMASSLRLGGGVTSLVGFVITVITGLASAGLGLALAGAITSLAGQVSSLGANFISNMFNSTLLDTLSCDIYNAFSADGSLTSANYATFITTLHSRGTADWLLVEAWFKLLGPIGMVAAGTSQKGGVSTCGTPPCDHTVVREYDYALGPQGATTLDWIINTGFPITPDPASVWRSGVGWYSTWFSVVDGVNRLWFYDSGIKFSIPADANIHRIEVDYYIEKGTGGSSDTMVSLAIQAAAGSTGATQGINGPSRGTLVNGNGTLGMDVAGVGVNALFKAGSIIRMTAVVMNAFGYYNTINQPIGRSYIKKLRIISA